ncbi:hypothetical protein PF005_g29852 [Phytophthora fragariae]|uniref:Uncharacterized protein n=1 Tax=Phytophthora fragariae TaxID=53985 RepID=A0A6A3VG31_9STRA|nr:hypothetical protein PF009_g30212 [Phytophthora fragariae]KAE9063123.1 hypothetical protein PF007_g29655 [Phytophthora fragariae]KAE9164841.1 hypothetical protein PF005_g29852 [Phytophthora fragariae]KAE9169877.1 hypothetical protein PF002_g30237 [Phytophthora fragariae]KAE9268642.1 hypothetical protein PF001_g29571 [Phytophthora fragariae]
MVVVPVTSPTDAVAPTRGHVRVLLTACRTAAVICDALDNASATTFVVPGLYLIVNSYSCSVSGQRCNRPANSALVISHFSAA